MGTIAIIPARGGSKGLPKKNLKELGGIPLLGRTVLAATKSKSVDAVYVTSDDPQILACAQHYGAETILRPETLSGDTASSESALSHALQEIEKNTALPQHFFFLQCTSPFLISQDLDDAFDTFRSKQADTLFSGSPFSHFVWRQAAETADFAGVNHDKSKRLRRQDREAEVLENGALYLMTTEGFLRHQHRFFGCTVTHLMPSIRSLEIDTPEDFTLAQCLSPLVEPDGLRKILQGVQALVSDFDGVLTDNKVHLDDEGNETVRLDRGDGMGIANLTKTQMPVLVLSSEQNPVVKHRCDKLGIPAIQTKEAKGKILKGWSEEQGIPLAKTAYIGNDVNDLPAFEVVGVALAVADAHPSVLQKADYIIPQKGGHGAVRAVCDALIHERGSQ